MASSITLNNLFPPVFTAFSVQLAGFVISAPLKTEKLYDFFGVGSFPLTTFVSLIYPRYSLFSSAISKYGLIHGIIQFAKGLSSRQLILTSCVSIWAARLSTHLLFRIFREGKDSRFAKVKRNPPLFFIYW